MSATSLGRFVATAVATGWLITGTVTQDAPDVRAPLPSGARPTATELPIPTRFTEKLHDRLRESATPDRGRNPFLYGARHSAPRRDAAEPAEVAPAPATVVVEPPPPVFKLSGIAASQGVLTAIIIDNGTMVFAKTGDKLSNGYSVVRVEEASVTLIDAEGVTQTLRLP